MAKPLFSLIELRHLRYFLAAAENGSFRKAGVVMGVKESSVSRSIRDLEAHLGASLFQRYHGGAFLNPAGERFLRQARSAMKHLGEAEREVGAIGRSESGHIRVGIFSSLASGFLRDLFQAYSAMHIGVRIDFVAGYPTEHIAAVQQHQLDAAFIAGTEQYDGCESTHLWSEQVFVVLPTAHYLVDRGVLAWVDLAGERFVASEQAPDHEFHGLINKRLASHTLHQHVDWQNVGRDNLMSLVAIGRGITLTSEAATAVRFPGIVYRPIEGETLPFSAVWSAKNDNPALRRLLSVAHARRKIVDPSALPVTMAAELPEVVAPLRTPGPLR